MVSRRASLFIAAMAAAAVVLADSPSGYRKPYFRATKPGTWAKHRMTATGAPEGFTTHTRLPDERGRQRLEVRVDYMKEDERGISFSDYTLEKGYSLEQDALSFGKAIEEASIRLEGETAEELSDEDLDELREMSPDFATSVTFVGTETNGGKTCDRYQYTQRHPGDPVQIETGEIWLNETVPFGLMRQRGVSKDLSGRVLHEFEMTLVDSGVGARAVPASQRPAATTPVKLADAYRDGQVELTIEILPGSPDGRRLRVRFKNKYDEALRLTIPSGETDLAAGPPVDTLRLDSESTWLYDLAPDETSPSVELSQKGPRRAVQGKFTISLTRGKPTLTGDATMETVK